MEGSVGVVTNLESSILLRIRISLIYFPYDKVRPLAVFVIRTPRK